MCDTVEMARRFARCPEDLQEWAEEAAYENLKWHISAGDLIGTQASAFLTLLLAGMGGSLAYAARLAEPRPTLVAWGAGATCIYLGVVATLLLLRCIRLRMSPVVRNSPDHLLPEGRSLAEVRPGELANVQRRIERQMSINSSRALWLDGLRMSALATPLVFTVAALLASRL